MTVTSSEPARLYWAAGITVSILVHTSAVAGAALLAGRLVPESRPTEITFSDEVSPAAAPLPLEAVAAPLLEAAQPVEQEELAASLAPQESVAAAAQPLAPQTAAPSQSVPTAALMPETVEPVKPDQAPATEGQPPVASAEPATLPALQPAEATAVVAPPVQPVQVGQMAAQEPASPLPQSAVPSAAEATPSTVQPAEASSVAAQPVQQPQAEQLAAQQVASPTAQPEAAATAVAATVAPPTASEAARQTESATVAASVVPQPLAAEANRESLSTLSDPVAATALAATPAETAAALPPAPSTAEPGIAAQSGALQPAPPPGAASADVISAAPQALQPAAPSPTDSAASAAAPATEAAQSVAPVAESFAGLAPELLPSTQSSGPETVAAAVVPAEPETVQPVEPTEPPADTALLAPSPPKPGTPAQRYGRVVDFVRGYGGSGDCFIALPTLEPDGAVTLQTFGRNKAAEDAFRRALLGADEAPADISGGQIADPQCQALSFARQMKRYPDFSLSIDLNENALARNNTLSGIVRNTQGRELYLLLVDEEGKVQSIDAMAPAGGDAVRRFSVQLSQSGQPVGTEQILMAVTVDRPLKIFNVNVGADQFLPLLARMVANGGLDIEVAVQGFRLR